MDYLWEAPGEGQWFLVLDHWPAPVTPLLTEIFPAVFPAWAAGSARYGQPHGNPRFAAVHGWYYYGEDLTPPDWAALDRAAATAVSQRIWLQEPAHWFDQSRPGVVVVNRALQAEDLARLSDDALADHFTRAVAHFRAAAPVHFLNKAEMAVGFWAEAAGRHGIGPAVALALLAGASPATADAARHVGLIAAALRSAGVSDVTDLLQVSAAGPAAAAAVDGYLVEHGWRVMGNDVGDPTLAESPEVLLASIRAGLAAASEPAPPANDALAAVPAEARRELETLLDEARRCYGVRDDTAGVCFMWPLGLIRRAMLEAGPRLAVRGALEDARHIFEAGAAEVVALLQGAGPPAAEMAGRAERRREAATAHPPGMLGSPVGPPSTDPLPPNVARIQAAAGSYGTHGGPAPVEGELAGTGIGTVSYRGRACVVKGALEAIDRLRPGDVLVTTMTTPAFNTVLPAAGALVVQEGGLMSHAAILARELGLPAVIGVGDVHRHLRDRDLVEVDPVAGRVRLIERA